MPTVSDYDGNSYSTVSINGVAWLGTNLKTKHLSSGKVILQYDPNFIQNSDGIHGNKELWYRGDTAMWMYVRNDPTTFATHGLLYNFAAVATGLLRPTSAYHVATAAEWAALITYYGTAAAAGVALKKDGVTVWNSPNTGATNSSSFAALPAGIIDRAGKQSRVGKTAAFWTATEDTTNLLDERQATKYFMVLDSATLATSASKFSCGLSVRCILS